MYSAIVGWDPVRYLLGKLQNRGVSKIVARTGLGIIGTGLIVTPMLASVNPLGGLIVLALLAILPISIALFGENPVLALYESCAKNRESRESDQIFDQEQDSSAASVVHYASRATTNESSDSRESTHHEAA